MVSADRMRLTRIPILAGPTASGKTSFALEQAERLGLEIINADSLLVYRHFDIGTAKPTAQEMGSVPHHLINIRDPLESFTAADFVRAVHGLAADLHRRNQKALIVGGTHFYLKALCLGLWDAPETQPEFRKTLESVETSELFERLRTLDPTYATKIGVADRYRIIRALEILEFSPKKPSQLESEAAQRQPDPRFPLLWIDRNPDEIEARIQARIQQMLAAGLIQETRSLLEHYPQARALHSVGYRQVVDFIHGTPPPGRAVRPGTEGLSDEIQLATRQLVKSQRTFLRGFEFAERFLFEEDRLKLKARIEEWTS
jgi:tRNA dimethylallyltransferase